MWMSWNRQAPIQDDRCPPRRTGAETQALREKLRSQLLEHTMLQKLLSFWNFETHMLKFHGQHGSCRAGAASLAGRASEADWVDVRLILGGADQELRPMRAA